MASDEEDLLYANDEFASMASVSQTLQTTSLEHLLADDKAEAEKADEMLRWYHGKISREAAEKLLKEGTVFLSADELCLCVCVCVCASTRACVCVDWRLCKTETETATHCFVLWI